MPAERFAIIVILSSAIALFGALALIGSVTHKDRTIVAARTVLVQP
ncbi:hypothetical protein HU230_0008025 [Bradyrhizobium quebecense]|uniref:Uncharacterized protein n=1 Tax=Bradyrhizobium quebecense TaxID=2748629 RepID=A0A973WQM3_9BRAD|nr:hypothetical protein [Bradyrhizobium quebecense]UGA45974.1 hypothetical protein HU230_0008025 [Bradyrhizobium quebecense]